MFCRLLFICLFKRSIALGVGVGLGLGIGLGLVLGLGLGVGLALGLGWVRFYMLQSQSARIKASLWRRIPRKNKRRQKNLGNRPLGTSNMAPAQPHVTMVAVYPALLSWGPVI